MYPIKYITIPRRYNDLKPKYIELYSINPPKIAPNIFEDSATPTWFSTDSSFENASPEKKIGTVKISGIIIFKIIELKIVVSTKVKKYPNNKEIIKRKYIIEDFIWPFLIINKFAR